MKRGKSVTFFPEVGWHLPSFERHLQGWMLQVNKSVDGRLAYQYHKYEAALPFVRPGRMTAVDIGAHVGLWSFYLSRDFQSVLAFEPVPLHRRCWKANMDGRENAQLFDCALGERDGVATLRTRTADSSGDTGVEPNAVQRRGDVVAPVKRLDDFELADVDFIKIDCEGYELFVLRGAQETLLRCKPCVIVEQKPETGMEDRYGIGTTDAVVFLEGLGAKRRRGIQGDYVLSWD